jgi:periplasmic protein TonB
VQPEYPEIARQAGIEGRVTLRVWVGKDGRVKEVQLVRSDNEIFNENAIAAVRRWRFEPAIQAGNPVDVWMTLPIRFRQRR